MKTRQMSVIFMLDFLKEYGNQHPPCATVVTVKMISQDGYVAFEYTYRLL